MNQVVETTKQTLQVIIDGLAPLAHQLGVAVEKIMEWAIKQNYAYAIEDLIPLLVLPFVYKIWKSAWNKAEKDDWNGDGVTYIAVFATLALIILSIGSIIGLTFAINRFVSPEINAIKDIVNITRELKNGNY